MTSRRGKRKHTTYSRNYEIPRPRAPLTCDGCGVPIECAEEETLKAFMNHNCKEKK